MKIAIFARSSALKKLKIAIKRAGQENTWMSTSNVRDMANLLADDTRFKWHDTVEKRNLRHESTWSPPTPDQAHTQGRRRRSGWGRRRGGRARLVKHVTSRRYGVLVRPATALSYFPSFPVMSPLVLILDPPLLLLLLLLLLHGSQWICI